MPKERLSNCCNAAVLYFKEEDETVCLACYHTTDVQEGLELEVVREREMLHKMMGQLIFLIVVVKIISLLLFLL